MAHPPAQIRRILPEVTFGVTSVNPLALGLCLTSVMTGFLLPGAILIRLQAELPGFSGFYFTQLAELARILGIKFSLNVSPQTGIRESRDWLMNRCGTPFLWMGDDDVVFDYNCLPHLREAQLDWPKVGYVAGIKVDVSNLRQYPDYDTHYRTGFPTQPQPSDLNHFYNLPANVHPPCPFLDCGNVLLHVKALREQNCRFTLFPDSVPNAGGEDTLFAANVLASGLTGHAAPSARSYHLEKERVVFTEQAMRAEMLLRARQLLKI